MFINNMVKYKAYLIESGYASDQTDEHFIKVAKLKRKQTLSKKGGGREKRSAIRKINFVTTWDPMFPDISGALKNVNTSWKRTRSVEIFSPEDHLGFHIGEVTKIWKSY